MSNIQLIRQQHIHLMSQTIDIIGHILSPVSDTDARTLRDGAEGWTIIEVLCHLRDADRIFRSRAETILQNDMPHLIVFEHEKMAIDQAYHAQVLARVYDDFRTSRQMTRTFFEQLSADKWERQGIHPEKGTFSLTDAVMQVGHHDVSHIEQMTRILTNRH